MSIIILLVTIYLAFHVTSSVQREINVDGIKENKDWMSALIPEFNRFGNYHLMMKRTSHRFDSDQWQNDDHRHTDSPVLPVPDVRQLDTIVETETADASVDNTSPETRLPKNLTVVRWGTDCSANNVYVFKNQDIMLRCEFWAPLGSSIRWLKNNAVVRDHHHAIPEENSLQDSGAYKKQFHIMTTFNIYCNAKSKEAYELIVGAPDGSVFRRTFKIWQREDFYGFKMDCCIMCKLTIRYSPQIVEFAKTVVGKEGEKLVLPCRKEGSTRFYVKWDKEDKQLMPANYKITNDGDLVIKSLAKSDGGMFTCTIASPLNMGQDSITTFVAVRNILTGLAIHTLMRFVSELGVW